MNNLFFILFPLSIIALIVGIFIPKRILFFLDKEKRNRKNVFLIFGIATIAFFALFIATADDIEETDLTENNTKIEQEELDKREQELDKKEKEVAKESKEAKETEELEKKEKEVAKESKEAKEAEELDKKEKEVAKESKEAKETEELEKKEKEVAEKAKEAEELEKKIVQETNTSTEKEQEYRTKLVTQTNKWSEVFSNFSDLMLNSEIGNDNWTRKVVVELQKMKDVIEDGRQLNPPKKFEEVNVLYMKAIDSFEVVPNELPTAIDNVDVNQMERITQKIEEGNRYIGEATELITQINN